ncbi:MAG: hypothetical protein AAGF97_17965, partial [Planctomycetota bacterium]
TSDVSFADQLQRQACELGERLQSRQRQLDQREASFHAQVAQLENELRSARLLQQELQHELADQKRKLQRREDELQREAADLLHAETAQREEVHEQVALASRLNENAKLTAAEWRRRLADLDKGERLIKSQLGDIAFQRTALERERHELARSNEERDQTIRRQREEEKQRFQTQLLKLQQRQEEVERRATSVQQLHQDTCETHRETLELRIATEQIWAKLSGQVSTAELTRQLAGWRKQLMDQFALANESLAQQRAENLNLLKQLEAQAETLKHNRDELREWMMRRQQELFDEAEKLLARERELDQEQANLRHRERQWAEEKSKLEQEVRRLNRLTQS